MLAKALEGCEDMQVFAPGPALGALMEALCFGIGAMENETPSCQLASLRSRFEWLLVHVAAGDAKQTARARLGLIDGIKDVLNTT